MKPAALQSKQIQQFCSLLHLFIGNHSLTDLQVFLGFDTDINLRPYGHVGSHKTLTDVPLYYITFWKLR